MQELSRYAGDGGLKAKKATPFRLDLPEGILTFETSLPAAPARVSHIVRNLFPFCDRVNELGAGIAAQFGKKISCGPGCGVCCRQMVPLSPPEAVHVAEVLQSLPDKRKEIISERFTAARTLLKQNGLIEKIMKLYMCSASDEEILAVNREYFDLHITCPFLENGSCSIYHERPSRCREYSVLSPQSLCEDPFDTRIRRLPVTVRLCESITYIWASLTGKPPRIIPLIDAPFWIENNQDDLMLTVDNPEPLMKAVLEHACYGANKRAKAKMAKMKSGE
ncbi:MAG: hypothetical protein GF401_18345 [Chitinivibrionales bacterium]|nr:hypothetical protein [Chitinivibrionales bacterium]